MRRSNRSEAAAIAEAVREAHDKQDAAIGSHGA